MPTWTIDEEGAGARLDSFLADHMAPLSRVQIQRLIRDGEVLVDAHTTRPARVLALGNRVTVADLVHATPRATSPTATLSHQAVSAGARARGLVGTPTAAAAAMPPQARSESLTVLYSDDSIIVVSKPAGLVTHPGAGDETDSVAGALLARYPDMREAFAGEPESLSQRPGIVHRLDKDTTGVMVVARTPEAAANLIAQFSSRRVQKVYLAVVWGRPEQDEAIIEAPIGRDPRQRQRMSALPSGKPAVTRYKVLDTGTEQSLLEAKPLTGRTHQIRVHLGAIGHPVVGDSVYGKRADAGGTLMLHAWQLALAHPEDGRAVSFREPPSAAFADALPPAGLSLPDNTRDRMVDA